MHRMSALEQRAALARGELSSRELVDHYLERIVSLDGSLGAFTLVTAEQARAAADRTDDERMRGATSGALHGLPLADKDLSRRAGVVTGQGSRLADDSPATESDEIVRRVDEAGAISLGKTSAPEYGMTAYGRNARADALGLAQPANPWDPSRDPGGSSAGAAVAVAAGLLPFAPGSDGGGSIRIPAAATGLIGVKPGRGLVPNGLERAGRLVVPGVLARDAGDAALLLSALVAPDRRAEEAGYLAAARRAPASGLRIGLLTDSPWRHRYAISLDTAAHAGLDIAVHLLESAGHRIEPVGLDDDAEYPEAFTLLWQHLAAGIPADGREELLEPFTRWLWRASREISADALERALATLERFRDGVVQLLGGCDLLLTPTLATTAVPREHFSADDPLLNFEQQCRFAPFTSFVNVTGLPAVSVPIGLSAVRPDRPALPVAVQLIGARDSEALLLSVAGELERARGPLPVAPPLR